MSAYNVLNELGRARDASASFVLDPGASGVIRPLVTDVGVCELVSTGAQSRSLETAAVHGVGTRLIVILKTDGGDVTVTGSDDGSVVLNDAGDYAIFIVTNVNGTHAWRTLNNGVTELDEITSFTVDQPIGNDFRQWDALITNLTGTSNTDDLGLVTGTFGTSNPTLNHTETNPAASSRFARKHFVLPKSYVAGQNVTLVLNVTETVAATTATVDAQVYDQDAPTLDICATAAQSVLAAAATDFSFTITGTNLVPGDTLDFRVNFTLTAAAASPNYSINSVKLSIPVLARTLTA